MNKKIFSRLLMGAVAAVTLSTSFVSCKDYDENLYADLSNEISDRNKSLKDIYDAELELIKGRLLAIEGDTAKWNACHRNCWNSFITYIEDHHFISNDSVISLIDARLTRDNLYNILGLGANAQGKSLDQIFKDYVTNITNNYNYNDSLMQAALDELKHRVDSLEGLTPSADVDLSEILNRLHVLDSITNVTTIKLNVVDSIAKAANTRADAAFTLAETVAAQAATNADSLKTLDKKIKEANDSISKIRTDMTNKFNEVDAILVGHGQRLDSLAAAARDHEARIEALEDAIKNKVDYDELQNTRDSLKNLYTIVQNNMDAVKTYVDQQRDFVLAKLVAEYVTKDELAATRAELEAAYQAADQQLQDKIVILNNNINFVYGQLLDLSDRVDGIQGQIDAIKAWTNTVISGVVVEGTYNPSFGYVNLPIGLQSNILAGFYGKAPATGAEFPSEDALGADFATLGGVNIKGYDTYDGNQMLLTKVSEDAEGVDVGTLYLTVNPSGVDFDGKPVVLQNSKGEQATASLLPLQKADSVLLKFGVGKTRSVANGFYQAKAYIPEDKINDAALTLNSEMKQSVKDLLVSFKQSLNQRQVVKKVDLSALAQNTYRQINDLFGEAYAAKATYQDLDGNDQNVLSGYDVAVRAINPLSYDFLASPGRSYNLPTLGLLDKIDLNDLINIDALKLDLSDIEFKDITYEPIRGYYLDMVLTLNVPVGATVTFNGTASGDGSGHVNGSGTMVMDPVTGEYTGEVDLSDITIVIDNVSVDPTTLHADPTLQWEDRDFNVRQWIPLEVVDEQVADLINGVESNVQELIGQLKEKMDGVTSGVNFSGAQGKVDQIINRINSIIGRVNGYINRINKYINNANAYLQPVLLYDDVNGQTHQLSGYQALPTRVKAGTNVVLTPTSMTAELVAPAYKKFVAVTHVWTDDNFQVEDTQARDNANAVEWMNEVLPGSQNAVVFAAGDAGKTYEIVYQAIDYSGKVRTTKYYVKTVQ